MDTEKDIVWEIPKGLLRWYSFKVNSIILYIGSVEDALAEMLRETSHKIECTTIEQTMEMDWQNCNMGKYDYIISITQLEMQKEPVKCLNVWRKLLKENGHLLLGMNNRYGLRYFCGDRDPYTKRNYDGIEDYRWFGAVKSDSFQGRCYNLYEIKTMLEKSGWQYVKPYSVMPDLKHPQLIYAEDYLPNEELASRFFPMYNYPPTVFLEEESIYTGLARNGMFHAMANTFLVECSLDGELSDVSHVTLTLERGRKEACMTVIHDNDIVEKMALYPEGEERLASMVEYMADLKTHGVNTVDARMVNHTLVMPYIHAQTAQSYLKQLIQEDTDKFILELDKLRDLILHSSEIVSEDKGDGKGAVLKKGYLDLVPLNSFYMDGDYIFYDQEFCIENCPANVVIMRMIRSLYFGNVEMEAVLPSSFFMERYGLNAELNLWTKMELEFVLDLRKEKKELSSYHEQNWRNFDLMKLNRKRMNFSEEDYHRIFVDIFRNADNRKLILFGSGKYARKFFALYHYEYTIDAIIDNEESKWGQNMGGVTIYSPEYLKELQPGEYKVMVCIKNYFPIVQQLEQMGITEYSVYEPDRDYPRKRKLKLQKENGTRQAENSREKYQIGYVAGVFDLFHIGHLNMFKRAKEQCDYLIVGVVTDERTERIKGKKPFIPFEERIELVRSCRYVDEAVEIPTDYGDTREAYQIYHFDCQFSGNDHINDPHWIAEKKYLEAHGAEMVFFPYTEGTSSTKIKGLIEKELNDK